MLLSPSEGALVQLFSRRSAGYFSPASALAFTVIYFTTTVVMFGLAVPSGLFVPAMLMGGGTGRVLGEALHLAGIDNTVDPGVYALLGAAGMLGGVTRMTMSLSMIVVELSGDLNLLLPAMVVVLTARLIAEHFNESIYLIQIKLNAVPILDAEDVEAYALLNVKAVMATKVCCLRVTETLANIVTALDTTSHHAFPLVGEESQILRGSARRTSKEDEAASKSVPMARPKGANRDASSIAPSGHDRSRSPDQSPEGQRNSDNTGSRQFAGIVTREQLEKALATSGVATSKGRIEAKTTDTVGSRLVDLRQYCDNMPFIVNEMLPLRRAFRLFQTMGLRHLCVLNHASCLVGVLTRKDFLNVRALDRSGMLSAIRRRRAASMRLLEEETRPSDTSNSDQTDKDRAADKKRNRLSRRFSRKITTSGRQRSWSWGTSSERTAREEAGTQAATNRSSKRVMRPRVQTAPSEMFSDSTPTSIDQQLGRAGTTSSTQMAQTVTPPASRRSARSSSSLQSGRGASPPKYRGKAPAAEAATASAPALERPSVALRKSLSMELAQNGY